MFNLKRYLFILAILAIVVVYILAAEIVKRVFYHLVRLA